MSDEKDTRTQDEIEADLESTREHLAETVDALQQRLDVKTRAGEKVAEVRQEHGRELAIGGAIAVVAIVVLTVVRRRRR